MGRRGTIRGVLIFIILATIPAYICGIGVWLFSPNPNAPQATNTPAGEPSWTPINPFDIFASITAAAVTNTPEIQATNTEETFQPVPITSQPFVTSTPLPPTFAPPPTNTSPPTNTPLPANTATFTPTEPILLPPSDTPGP